MSRLYPPFNPADNLINISFEDVITAVHSNEKTRDKEAVIKVYKEILKTALKDAEALLKENMDDILKELKD